MVVIELKKKKRRRERSFPYVYNNIFTLQKKEKNTVSLSLSPFKTKPPLSAFYQIHTIIIEEGRKRSTFSPSDTKTLDSLSKIPHRIPQCSNLSVPQQLSELCSCKKKELTSTIVVFAFSQFVFF